MCLKNGQLYIIKSAKKIPLKEPLYKMELYMIRSLFREYEKSIYAENKQLLNSYEREKRRLIKERDNYYRLLGTLNANIRDYLGFDYKNFKKWLHTG